jgi:polyisoprenoid-binding protein YceI
MTNKILGSLFFVASASLACAAPISFDFKDPKGVNSIAFHLDAPLESIAGVGKNVSGTATFDPAAPEATSGKIVLATKSLAVTNDKMTEHMLGKNWLAAEQNPEITFEFTRLQNAKTENNVTTAEAIGKLTLKGVTKDITVPVKISYLPDQLGKRVNKPDLKGDLLVVRSEFTIKRNDFDVNVAKMEDRVSEEVKITLALAGSAPKS